MRARPRLRTSAGGNKGTGAVAQLPSCRSSPSTSVSTPKRIVIARVAAPTSRGRSSAAWAEQIDAGLDRRRTMPAAGRTARWVRPLRRLGRQQQQSSSAMPAINPPGPAFARHPRFPSAIRWFSADSPESRRFHGAPIRRAETGPSPPIPPPDFISTRSKKARTLVGKPSATGPRHAGRRRRSPQSSPGTVSTATPVRSASGRTCAFLRAARTVERRGGRPEVDAAGTPNPGAWSCCSMARLGAGVLAGSHEAPAATYRTGAGEPSASRTSRSGPGAPVKGTARRSGALRGAVRGG